EQRHRQREQAGGERERGGRAAVAVPHDGTSSPCSTSTCSSTNCRAPAVCTACRQVASSPSSSSASSSAARRDFDRRLRTTSTRPTTADVTAPIAARIAPTPVSSAASSARRRPADAEPLEALVELGVTRQVLALEHLP